MANTKSTSDGSTVLPAAQPDSTEFVPTPEQFRAIAQRLMPEVKSFFADEQIQVEFAEWQETQNPGK